MSWLAMALALLGPGVIAVGWKRRTRNQNSLAISAPWLGAFALLLLAVVTLAVKGNGWSAAALGLEGVSWLTIPFALVLTAFFVYVFGPLAYAFLSKTGLGSFDDGQRLLATLPTWYLALTIVVVAGGEEWLYRGYAIEALEAATGSLWLASLISLLAFAIVHLPLWGKGVALTTIVSGGILTLLYAWRRDVALLALAHALTDLYGLLIVPRLQARPARRIR